MSDIAKKTRKREGGCKKIVKGRKAAVKRAVSKSKIE